MTTDEKGVFIQIQNTIVSSKALVLVNCLNTFAHDCRLVKQDLTIPRLELVPGHIAEKQAAITHAGDSEGHSIEKVYCWLKRYIHIPTETEIRMTTGSVHK